MMSSFIFAPVVAVWSSVEDMAGAPVEDVTGDLVVVVAGRMIMMTTMTMMTIALNLFFEFHRKIGTTEN